MNMKPILAAFALVASVSSVFAQLIIPSDGSDGAFSPVANIEVDLSQAVTGTWSDPSSIPSKGIYDAQKWAIVFKYSSVNIPAGVTVTFKNHPTHAPVVWLVQGSVTVFGTVSVDGKTAVNGPAALNLTEPGPGGFRGGAVGAAGTGWGLGIGGGGNGGHGAYSTSYGNPQILPLIGGSGGNGGGSSAGGAGGGAILIAAATSIQVTGSITALGGVPTNTVASGGAIKLIANNVLGTGNVNAGSPSGSPYFGRARIEANSLAATIVTTPPTIAVPPGTTPTIFQSTSSPVVKIISVDGLPSPADPTAPLVSSADIAIQKNTPVTVVLKTYNFATAGAVVALRVAGKYGGLVTVNATLQGGGTSAESTWTVSTPLSPGFVTLQARATAP